MPLERALEPGYRYYRCPHCKQKMVGRIELDPFAVGQCGWCGTWFRHSDMKPVLRWLRYETR